jgi:hypothetical protein
MRIFFSFQNFLLNFFPPKIFIFDVTRTGRSVSDYLMRYAVEKGLHFNLSVWKAFTKFLEIKQGSLTEGEGSVQLTSLY